LQRDALWSSLARAESAYLRGFLALARAMNAPTPALRATAIREARRLKFFRVARASAYAASLRAGLAILDGNANRAGAQLAMAAKHYAASGMVLDSHCARLALGRITGGTAGRAMVAEAEAFMREQTIVDPERWTRCLVPGFARLSRQDGLE